MAFHFNHAYQPGDYIGDLYEMTERTVLAGRVDAYAMKIPPYWTSDPQICFVQVEAQVAARGIRSQRTMYQHVVGSLSPEIATEVRDLLLKPPETQPYDALKKMLIECTSA